MSEGVTIWFETDIQKIWENPFHIETAFGKPTTIGKGNEFSKSDLLRDALVEACERLEKAGFPANDLERIATDY